MIARYTIGVVTCNDCPVDHRRRQWHPRKVHETGRLTMEVAANSQSVARDADAAGEKLPDAYWRAFSLVVRAARPRVFALLVVFYLMVVQAS